MKSLFRWVRGSLVDRVAGGASRPIRSGTLEMWRRVGGGPDASSFELVDDSEGITLLAAASSAAEQHDCAAADLGVALLGWWWPTCAM